MPYREPPKDVGLKVIKTAVEGVLTVMRAAEKDGGVKRVVLTSSIAAVRDFAPEKRLPPGTPYTEEHWSDIEYQEKIARYKVSKTLQEKAAWEFVKNMPVDRKFELVALCPSLLVGKSLYKGQTNTSIEMMHAWFTGKVPPFHSKFSWVAIADVARAHLLAIKIKEAAGHRFILNQASMWVDDMVRMFNREFGPQGYTISLSTPPYAMVWLASFFMDQINGMLRLMNNDYTVSTEKAQRILGIKFTPIEPVMLQVIYQSIEVGRIPDPRRGPKMNAKL